jgi:hypothetical protein
MSEFKWHHFSSEIILQCVRWYCKYGISYRDLEEMMADLEWDELEGVAKCLDTFQPGPTGGKLR